APARSLVLYEPVARPFGDHVLPRLRAALAAEDLDTAVEMINVDLSGYSREHVAQLRCTPAWPRLRELAVPSAEELGAIERFPLDPAGYRSSVSRSPSSRASSAATARRTEARWSACAP